MNQLSILLTFFIIVGFARSIGLISADALSMIIGITVGAITATPLVFLFIIYPAHGSAESHRSAKNQPRRAQSKK